MRIDEAAQVIERAYAILERVAHDTISPHGWGSTYLLVCRRLGREPSWQPSPADLLAAARRLEQHMEAA